MTNSTSQPRPERASLHARAIEALLSQLDQQRGQVPSMDMVADRLGITISDLRSVFPDLQSVLDAAAEEALLRLFDTAVRSMVAVDADDYLRQFSALGEAFIDWALMNPAHFLLTMDRDLVNLKDNPTLARYHEALRNLLSQLLKRALDSGQIRPDTDIGLVILNARAMAYGLARMVIDRHMAEWYPGEDPVAAIKRGMRAYIEQVAEMVGQGDEPVALNWPTMG